MRRARGAGALVASALGSGCLMVGTPPTYPAVTEPALLHPVEVPTMEADPVLTPPPPVVEDAILDSEWRRHPVLAERVAYWQEYWRGRGADDFQIYLDRMQWFRPLVEAEIARRELPPSLMYLPMVESGYTAGAVSSASAVGLWQFMAPTARERGLTVDAILDERRDPVRATPEALEFLGELRERFGSWYLALAAYNGGPSRMAGLLRRRAALIPRSDSLFVALREELPRETQEFVPRLIAASLLARDPASNGFRVPDGPTMVFDQVPVEGAVSVDVIARAAGASQAEIERLNPQLLRGFTPPNGVTTVRVPEGRGASFEVALAEIPVSERISFLEHRVTPGETFSHIARRYGVAVDTLRAANPDTVPRRLQIGQWVVIPVAPRATATTRAGPGA